MEDIVEIISGVFKIVTIKKDRRVWVVDLAYIDDEATADDLFTACDLGSQEEVYNDVLFYTSYMQLGIGRVQYDLRCRGIVAKIELVGFKSAQKVAEIIWHRAQAESS